jgi:hypothetical protein
MRVWRVCLSSALGVAQSPSALGLQRRSVAGDGMERMSKNPMYACQRGTVCSYSVCQMGPPVSYEMDPMWGKKLHACTALLVTWCLPLSPLFVFRFFLFFCLFLLYCSFVCRIFCGHWLVLERLRCSGRS